jgi:hypothetical protein
VNVLLKDGRTVDIDMDPTWGKEEQQRAIREWKAKDAQAAAEDPSATDSWPAYAGKTALSAVRGGGAGIVSTIENLANSPYLNPSGWVGRKLGQIGSNLYEGKPAFSSPQDDQGNPASTTPGRDLYESVVPARPKGYETAGKVSEVVTPGVVEAALMPEATVGRMAMGGVDAGLGYLGGKFGRQQGEDYGRQYFGEPGAKVGGTLGELLGGALAPAAATRTATRLTGTGVGHVVGGPIGGAISGAGSFGGPILRKLGIDPGRLDPYSYIPPTSVNRFVKGRAPIGALSAATTGTDDQSGGGW